MMMPLAKPAPFGEKAKMKQCIDVMSIASLLSHPDSAYGASDGGPRAEPICSNGQFASRSPASGTKGHIGLTTRDGTFGSTGGGWPPTWAAKKEKSARPVYTEEQKFFIVYARVVLDQSWPDIEDRFAEIFEHRSKDGITSMYYRIRKNWGLKDILKAGPDSYVEDKQVVIEKASYFSVDFLSSVGYYF